MKKVASARILQAKEELGQFLKGERERAGLTLDEAAKHLEFISADSLEALEAGRLQPSMAEIYAFANIYDISPETLMTKLLALQPELPTISFKLKDLHRKEG